MRRFLLRHPSGRKIEYAEYGDPAGTPFLFFNGFFGSSAQGGLIADTAEALGMHVIAPNRPGVGRTTFYPYETIRDYAEDAVSLADMLGWERFGVIGVSSGSAYALACGAIAPERITVAACGSVLAPLENDAFFKLLSAPRKRWLSLLQQYPHTVRAFLRMLRAWHLLQPNVCRQKIVEFLSAACPQLRANALMVRTWEEDVRQMMRGRLSRALAHEAQCFFRWGFTPAFLSPAFPLFLWHSKDDSVAPIAMAQAFADTIPHAKMHHYSGDHFDIMHFRQEILSEALLCSSRESLLLSSPLRRRDAVRGDVRRSRGKTKAAQRGEGKQIRPQQAAGEYRLLGRV